MNKIEQFVGEYFFLSNFFPMPMELDGLRYQSLEHAYQACKMAEPRHHEAVRKAGTPGKAKKLGRELPMRSDWEEIKIPTMLHLLRVKFSEPSMRERLIKTGDAELIEGNTWKDKFWGVCNGVGQNNLGKLLMQVRDELRVTTK